MNIYIHNEIGAAGVSPVAGLSRVAGQNCASQRWVVEHLSGVGTPELGSTTGEHVRTRPQANVSTRRCRGELLT
ncbi:hypothetical protein EH165_09900 [Nakamurella antarctica]|uniref:Uncharacterized protein n=1 Tax=Nakamurella antarctica TaxID=1902245 RepID=A0A3G8ZVA2_9ACTN|nr:hypothetical protein [Nakamurella antarctica]AZI58404.1 hypothetical protein EH165_09900 [Nakamurella antarctica]